MCVDPRSTLKIDAGDLAWVVVSCFAQKREVWQSGGMGLSADGTRQQKPEDRSPIVAPQLVERAIDLPMLDGLRAVAAILVLLTHAGFLTGWYSSGPLGALLARMDFGVALFFALSGFLLSRSYVAYHDNAGSSGHKGPPNLKRYALHRLARIVPAYWVALLAVVVCLDHAHSASAIASNVTLTQVYTGDLLPGFTQTWSLCTEVAFYIALPWLATWVYRGWARGLRRPFARLVILGIGALIWTGLSSADALPWGPKAGQWLPGHLDWFAVGMAIALMEPLIRRADRRISGVRTLLTYPGTAVTLALMTWFATATALGGPLFFEPGSPVLAMAKELLYAVAAMLFVAVATFSDLATSPMRVLATAPMRSVGRISYAIFLWHLLILEGVINALGIGEFQGGFIIVSIATLAISLVIAAASWLVVERPMLKLVGART